MNSTGLKSFNNKALSTKATGRIIGGGETSDSPTGTEVILLDPKPKTTPISTTATHIKPDDEDLTKPLTLQLP